METQTNQQNAAFSLPGDGTEKKFDTAGFLKQLRKVKSMLTKEDLEILKGDDRETQK